MHSIYISRTLNPMHSDYCGEMEGDSHAGYLSRLGLWSKRSKNFDVTYSLIEQVCFRHFVLVVIAG